MRLCQIWNSSHFHSAQSRAAVLIYNPAALGLCYKSYCISAILQRDDICLSRAYHTALPLQLYQDLNQENMLWDSLPLVCLPNLTFAQKAHNIITCANSGGRKQSWIRLSALPRQMLLPMLLLCWVLQIVPDLYYWETLFRLSNISSRPNSKFVSKVYTPIRLR